MTPPKPFARVEADLSGVDHFIAGGVYLFPVPKSGIPHETGRAAKVTAAHNAAVNAAVLIEKEKGVKATAAAPAAPTMAPALRRALGVDIAGRPFWQLLDEAADVLHSFGGGPMVDCLREKAAALQDAGVLA